jgi:hypothetical protein
MVEQAYAVYPRDRYAQVFPEEAYDVRYRAGNSADGRVGDPGLLLSQQLPRVLWMLRLLQLLRLLWLLRLSRVLRLLWLLRRLLRLLRRLLGLLRPRRQGLPRLLRLLLRLLWVLWLLRLLRLLRLLWLPTGDCLAALEDHAQGD